MKNNYNYSLIVFIILFFLSQVNTFSQVAKPNIDSFKIKAYLIHPSYAEYAIVKSSKNYTLYFTEFKNERTIYVSANNKLVCLSSLLHKNDSTGYVSTFCFSVSDLENKEALELLTDKFIQSLFAKSKSNQLSKYNYFSEYNSKNNWVAFKLKKPIIAEGGIVNNGAIAKFKDFMCRNDWICPVTSCEACKRALCDLADCFDENGAYNPICHDESEWEKIVCIGGGRTAIVYKTNLNSQYK